MGPGPPGAAALTAAAPAAAAPGPWSSRPCSSRPWPLEQPHLQQPLLAPGAAAPAAAAPAPGAAAPAAAAPGPWSSRPCSSRPWPLEQPPLQQPPLAPGAAAPAAAAEPSPCSGSSLAVAAVPAAAAVMATPAVLTFDAEGRAIDFEVWLDDLQLFLQCDSKDGLLLFDLTSGASPAFAVDADSTVRSQWTTRDAAARLAVRSHLPSTERAHFSQYKSAKTLYDAVVARYSSPASAALSRLMLPYLFPDLAAFATVADLITHLRTSDTRYRAALPAEFRAQTPPPPPMYITLYYLVTRLPDSLRSVRDHFLALYPTTLTVDLLEEHLLAAEKSIVAVGASRGDPRTPFFEGCSPVPLLPSVASAAAVDLVGTESVDAAFALAGGTARAARARGARVLEELAGVVVVAVEATGGVGVEVGVVAEVGALVAAVEAEAAAAAAVGVEEVAVAAVAAVAVAAVAVALVGVAPCSGEASVVASVSSSSALVRPRHPSSFTSGTLRVSGLGVLVPVPTSCVLVTALGSRVAACTPPSAASAA
ncbi:unnamed protein product [Closterium sp. Yama58-4]|nr:unnamed protein product [Closterium sp. Yama58-4]